MTDIDLAAIRERARLCAYQEWEDAGFNHRFQEGEVVADNASVSVAIVNSPYDLEHIAGMDPATTIALLDEIDRLRKDLSYEVEQKIKLAEMVESLRATIDRVQALAEKMQNEHGQSWNSISGNRVSRALEGGEQ